MTENNRFDAWNPDRIHASDALTVTLCLPDESILISQSTLLALGMPRQVQMLINRKKQMLAVTACSNGAQDALVVITKMDSGFELSGRSLIRLIRSFTGWMDNTPRMIRGEYREADHTVFFDLHNATPVDIGAGIHGYPVT